MTLRVRFSPEAKDDLEALKAYIARDNSAAAVFVTFRIRKLITTLAGLPFLGKKSEIKDVYKIPVGSLPYLVVYEVRAKEIRIIRVYHGSRGISY